MRAQILRWLKSKYPSFSPAQWVFLYVGKDVTSDAHPPNLLFQDPRNGNISGISTSDLESLENEMERLRLQAQVTPKATATALARRFVIFPVYRSCY
jgi:hypothetical protein